MESRSELFLPFSKSLGESLTFYNRPYRPEIFYTDEPMDDELGIESIEQKSYNIRSRIEAHVTVIGQPSGNTYVFPKAGSIVEVAEADIPFLLAKHLGKSSCCGGGNPDSNVMFEIVN